MAGQPLLRGQSADSHIGTDSEILLLHLLTSRLTEQILLCSTLAL
jgi:hypothetical protein